MSRDTLVFGQIIGDVLPSFNPSVSLRVMYNNRQVFTGIELKPSAVVNKPAVEIGGNDLRVFYTLVISSPTFVYLYIYHAWIISTSSYSILQCCHAWSFEMINTNDIIGFLIHMIFFLICKIIVIYTWHVYVILIYEEIYLVIIFSTSYISYN